MYNWLGDCVLRNPNPESGGEFSRGPTEIKVWDHNYFTSLIVEYRLDNKQKVTLASAPTYVARDGRNQRLIGTDRPDVLQNDQNVLLLVNGLEYEWKSEEKGLEFLIFGKSYLNDLNADFLDFENLPITREEQKHYWGYGAGFRKTLTQRLALKGSYEWSTRLPTANELFGDGNLTRANIRLQPERSHNANLELSYTTNRPAAGSWKGSANLFYRDAENIILLLPFGPIFVNQNVFEALSVGVELTGTWASKNERLQISGNATWQDFRNKSDDGVFRRFENDRIPNQPYLFGNLASRYRFNDLLGKFDQLDIFASSRYVNEFFRNWESVQASNKIEIPSQFTHNLGITYSENIAGSRTSLTLEAQNITNVEVFDLFGVQLPRRMYFVKLSTTL